MNHYEAYATNIIKLDFEEDIDLKLGVKILAEFMYRRS